MSNKQLRSMLRLVHLIAGGMLIAFVFSDVLRESASYTTLMRIIVPIVGISGIVMWQQASLSRFRRRLSAKTNRTSVEVS